MKTKDYFEIIYWAISVCILGLTIYWIKTSPIEAVKTGRELDNQQNKYNTKMDLFLLLFSLRGNPTHRDFVNGLNQIDIVFEDSFEVLAAWEKLLESLNNRNGNTIENLNMLRTDMLSAMAQHLGYQKLKQTTILRTYSPQAHLDYDTSVQEYNNLMRSFFESGTKMHNLYISHYGQNQSGEVKS